MGTSEQHQSGYTLYTTPGCHLCEHAEEIISQIGLTVTAVDIAEEPELIRRFGVRIPVVADTNGRELGWPFDATGLKLWLAGENSPPSPSWI